MGGFCVVGLLYEDGRTKQGYNKVIGTNYVGHFLLTHLLSELMKKSAPSRVINIASSDHGRVRRLDMSYCTTTPSGGVRGAQLYPISKLCLIMHANELGRRLKGECGRVVRVAAGSSGRFQASTSNPQQEPHLNSIAFQKISKRCVPMAHKGRVWCFQVTSFCAGTVWFTVSVGSSCWKGIK